MPPKKTETVESSTLEELAADAVPDEYPEGAPSLKSYLDIRPRSRRAEFKRKYAEFAKKNDETQKRSKAGGDNVSDQMELWADYDDILQLMDELMEMAADDHAAYRKWADEAEDADITVVFNVFSKRSQPGEASRSAT